MQNRTMTSRRFTRIAARRSGRLAIGLLWSAASVALMAGCSSYWGASGDTFVEYSGIDQGKVQACANFSADPEHRNGPGMSLYIVVADIEVVSPIDGAWEISGTTKIVDEGGGDPEYLAWSCRVTIDADARSMHAELVDTGPGQEVPLCGPSCSAPSRDSIEIESDNTYDPDSWLPCIDIVAAVVSPPEQTGPPRVTVRSDHDAPSRRFHGTFEPPSQAAYQWTCQLPKAYDPWSLDYELTALEPQ
ncbi:hypothetical protein [Agromyces albus]|uniref:Uncharacterized protein n=1 Tax=Agromyces albus TaxID=205332 RepID=A0A4Q2L4S0_9MICO|nr:hypothetical protein [Agromyces albus]RXZ71880.1 hypothetical protein ESP51_07050 [Agromyces albus]